MAQPGFWNDNETAQKVQQKRSQLQRAVTAWNDLNKECEDLGAMIELAEEDGDESLNAEIESAKTALREKVAQVELKAMLSGENDFNNALMTINSGAGGTESQDWAQMLLRMYTRWAERNGYKCEILDMQYGEEAGIKSATVNFTGDILFHFC